MERGRGAVRLGVVLPVVIAAVLALAGTALAGPVTGSVSVPVGYSKEGICVSLHAADGSTVLATARTDVNGDFTIATDVTGTVQLSGDAEAYQCSQQPLIATYPGPFTLGSGTYAHPPIPMIMPDPDAVYGTVSTGGVNDGVCVVLLQGSTVVYSTTTSNGGRYVFASPDYRGSSYTVRAYTSGEDCGDRALLPQTTSSFTIGGGPLLRNITLGAGSASAMAGTIIVPAGVSSSSICVEAYLGDIPAGSTTTDPAGHWGIRGLAAGTYYVSAWPCGGLADTRNFLMTTETHVLGSGVSDTGVDITLLPGAAIDGTLVAAPGAAMPACVYLMPSGSTDPADAYRGTSIDSGGRFRFIRVYAGSYDYLTTTSACEDAAAGSTWYRENTIVSLGDTATVTLRMPGSDVTATSTAASSAGGATSTATRAAPELKVSRTRVAGSRIVVTFTASGPGTATASGVAASAKRGARAGVKVCTGSVKVKKAGTVTIGCALNAAGRKLRKQGALSVVLTTTFTPKGGVAAVSTRTVAVPKR